ncbi:membrane protein insertion efficiency factor YidD [Mycobacterium sp. 1164985.4]|uniref:membrane protein insertion efficiency factor YidD n=1 Tax=Mycobacterium sp. 1164985.4 TaxID=1834069 RepID=UPI000801A2B7|nr:membrane protein insertion efficiency factor YidD [Mycobacterium sp. 1164985.4]OBK77011.1 membrane protein insertion efficiency factor YidD [Mycobacterium sp. 1164985.4]
MRAVGAWTARAVIYVIQLYRHTISPLRLPTCRFTPTCSQYAVDALTEYGLVHGGWLATVRLLKCGPWHKGGWDPIPDRPAPDGQDDAHASGAPAGESSEDRGTAADVSGGHRALRAGSETRV